MTAPNPGRTVPVPTGPTYSSPSPEAELHMDMVNLWTIGKTTIPGQVDELADALDKISNALESIELNWAGDSQKQAQEINERWQNCARALFGTKEHPEVGVLNRIAGGLQGAALNYHSVEEHTIEMWQKYIDLLNQMLAGQSPGDSGGGGGQQSPPISEV
ncbi:hypothetical protein BDK92_3760 [Micromonospora pisi]|uniref:WXG100 family type VII secretion target n=1 Tax=Micromonospora pisi TaxID=589240 RepID=A0A495JM56_9ACTN|nr:hypothetical protein [Micromonospora pisi]RKR89414.1 hypothetical protein BDK92_3760 [Micromonospora pisi]